MSATAPLATSRLRRLAALAFDRSMSEVLTELASPTQEEF
jgi:hypothetical protein